MCIRSLGKGNVVDGGLALLAILLPLMPLLSQRNGSARGGQLRHRGEGLSIYFTVPR